MIEYNNFPVYKHICSDIIDADRNEVFVLSSEQREFIKIITEHIRLKEPLTLDEYNFLMDICDEI